MGALSAFNALASAYAESLPVILISGSPNTNDLGAYHLLHHTLGTLNFNYQLEMARHITCEAVAITHPEEAPYLIDKAIRSAFRNRKSVYIEIPCNLTRCWTYLRVIQFHWPQRWMLQARFFERRSGQCFSRDPG